MNDMDLQDRHGRRLPPLPKFLHPDDMPDRYALKGIGTCMEPLLADGTLCVFDKRQEPEAGDVVGVIFTEEARRRFGQPGMIKRLVMPPPPKPFEGWCIVEQINLHRTYTLSTEDVLALHKFVGVAQSLGNGIARFDLPEQKEAA